MNVDLQMLVGRLNKHCRSALEGAVGFTFSRTHYNVEIEHWLSKFIETSDNDIAFIFRHFDIDSGRVAIDVSKVLDHLKTGNSRSPALAPNIVKWIREAWVYASLQSNEAFVRSGHLMVSFLCDDMLSALARDVSPQFSKINSETLRTSFLEIVTGSREVGHPAVSSAGQAIGHDTMSPATSAGERSALEQYTINLTTQAREGKIDPVLGRDTETRQIIDILTRRRQNNPILTGEAGVGKTAVVEGFALKIAAGDVPPSLRDVDLLSLDLGLLQAGAGMKGEFENRLKNVIEEVKASLRPIIMFIDEAHMLIGAGGAAGQNDAANLLKPALARGEMRTIAVTTWAEYKKYFERDSALTRRFQVVKVEEPSNVVAIGMIQGLLSTLEDHHGVCVLAEAVEEAVRLSRRYIPGRQLPDKAISLLDTACGRVAMTHHAVPSAIENLRRSIEMLDVDLHILAREIRIGTDHSERVTELEAIRAKTTRELEILEQQWEKERQLVSRIRELHKNLSQGDGGDSPTPLRDATRAELTLANAELNEVQGENPLMRVTVDGQAIAEIVGHWTGIPVGRMVSNEIKTILGLKERLEERIIGQSHALKAIVETIQTSRAKLIDPRKPIGVFLMVGTSGVGKTETALALADLLYGGEQNLTIINMSEFKEEHKVSMLVGSPPGYVGYGEGGVLTEAVRRRPYSVVLLDEMEKAHPGVQDVFYQVFDKGMLRDGEGRDIDFKNTIIIMTSNAGCDLIPRLYADPTQERDVAQFNQALHPELLKSFKPAFLGRCSVIPYFPLADEVIQKIVELQLKRIGQRFQENYRARLTWDVSLVEEIANRCTEVESGARNIEHILSRELLPRLSAHVLSIMADNGQVGGVEIGFDDNGQFTFIEESSQGKSMPLADTKTSPKLVMVN